MTITVTQEHIDKGTRCVKKTCAVALAMTEAGFANVEVFEDCRAVGDDESEWFTGASWTNDEKVIAVELPPSAARFVAQFDMNRSVTPFTFELEL